MLLKRLIIVTLFVVLWSNLHASEQTKHLLNLLPSSDWSVEWKWDGDPQYFYSENLYEYINGSADLYNSYGFQELVTINYAANEDQYVILDIYDMGTSLNAFGIFSKNLRKTGNSALISSVLDMVSVSEDTGTVDAV